MSFFPSLYICLFLSFSYPISFPFYLWWSVSPLCLCPSVPFPLSLFLSLFPSVSFPVSLPLCLFSSVSFSLYIFPSVSFPSISFSLSLSLCISSYTVCLPSVSPLPKYEIPYTKKNTEFRGTAWISAYSAEYQEVTSVNTLVVRMLNGRSDSHQRAIGWCLL
jgi:hypothetical protein